MARRHLTAIAVEKLRAGTERREIPVSGCQGLYLIIQPTGAKSWHLRYRRPADRKSVKLKLGDMADTTSWTEPEPVMGAKLTLAAAKRLAADLSHKIAQGQDPATEHRLEVAADTFAEAVRDFLDYVQPQRSWRDMAGRLGLRDGAVIRGSLLHRWGSKPLHEIDEDLVFKAIEEARAKGIPGLGRRTMEPSEARARALHSALSRLFSWCKAKRRVRVSPVAGLERPKPPKARERVLEDDEIRKFWQATGSLPEPFSSALRLMLVTGQRREEVAGMRLSELSEDLSTWKLPPSRTKNKREHTVPLPPMARDIIRAVQRVPGSDLIFTTTGRKPIAGWSKIKRRLDALMGIEPWVVHDLRRTAVTGMAEAGVDLHVIERAINHVSGSFGGIVGVYQKHKFADEVRAALEAWGNLLTQIIEGAEADNVVQLRGR